jgi:hypothetical protein
MSNASPPLPTLKVSMSLQHFNEVSRILSRQIPYSRIYALNDPWLGTTTQLMPLPLGLMRILIVALPAIVLPHLLTYLKRASREETPATMLDQLSQWLTPTSPATSTAPSTSSTCRECTHQHIVRIKHTGAVLFTYEQGTRMYTRFSKYARQCNGTVVRSDPWKIFLHDRPKSAISEGNDLTLRAVQQPQVLLNQSLTEQRHNAELLYCCTLIE